MSYSRQSNLELLRICCMLMIVAGHIILYHKTPHLLTNNEEILKLLGMSFFSVAVNSFVLISGYFGIKFKTDRFLHLIIQIFSYSVILMCLSVAIDWHTFNIKQGSVRILAHHNQTILVYYLLCGSLYNFAMA